MNLLYFDSIGGASGDMILAALLDAGADLTTIRRALQGLALEPFRIEAQPHVHGGLRGTQVHVHAEPPPHAQGHGHPHPPHRGLTAIRELIRGGGLPDRVAARGVRVFERLAEAEARMHATTPEQVHFHEVGAVDAVVDIVGACLALEQLNMDAIAVGPLPLSHGLVQCAHGTLPVPAPATLELLAGMTLYDTNEPFELVTPTGAALLGTLKTLDRLPHGCRLVRTGCGYGHRTLAHRPNLLRALLMETPEAAPESESCLVLETNIDDANPEWVGALTQRLLDAGALDVFTTAVQMKKQRPGILLTVLCEPHRREALLDLIFRESTTFGVREYPTRRTMLARRVVTVTTPYGPIEVKVGIWQGRPVTHAPEYEACVRTAREAHVAVRQVYEAAQRATPEI